MANNQMTEPVLSQQTSPLHSSTWIRAKVLSPSHMLLLTAAAIFFCEFFDMVLLNRLPPFLEPSSPFEVAVIDACFLLLLLTPFYLILYRPFWKEHQTFSREVHYLSRELINAIEMERKRLTQDIHDHCGQKLTTLQFDMEILRKSLDPENTIQLRQTQEISQKLANLSHDLRQIIHNLRPTDLDEIGLFPAIQNMMKEISMSSPTLKIYEHYQQAHATQKDLSEQVSLAVYRICQEGFNNIAKHAQASEARLLLETTPTHLSLAIEDNGIGFKFRSPGDNDQSFRGIGLLGIRVRASDLGGTFSLDTSPGKGTSLRVTIPFQAGGANV